MWSLNIAPVDIAPFRQVMAAFNVRLVINVAAISKHL